MTVKELIRELQKFPGDNQVVLWDYDVNERDVESVQSHPDDKEVQTRVMIH